MATLQQVVLEVEDPAATTTFLTRAFDLGADGPVVARPGDAPTSGFRGFVLSLVVPQPSTVDSLFATAVAAGATATKPPSRSLWGYGAGVQAPDGTVWTIASSSRKETGAPGRRVDDLVLLLGVDDVKASRAAYVDRGFEVTKSYGGKYAELGGGALTLALTKRRTAARNAGVDESGTGDHRLTAVHDGAAFTDPDGYAWRPATVLDERRG